MKNKQKAHIASIDQTHSSMGEEQELTEEQLAQIQGGLNPQPLPPGARHIFRFDFDAVGIKQGIIIVSGYQK